MILHFNSNNIIKLMLILIINLYANIAFSSEMPNVISNATAPMSQPFPAEDYSNVSCEVPNNKSVLMSGWFEWKPYQYLKKTPHGEEVTGIDIEIISRISKKIGYELQMQTVTREESIKSIQNGTKDLVPSALRTKEREKYAFFSKPYRYEEDSIFVRTDGEKELAFNNLGEFLAQIRALNFKIGVVNGAIYADEKLNNFISDSLNSDIVIKNENGDASLKKLLNGEIDGFVSDRLAGSALVLDKNVGHRVQEISLNIKTPIHLMFSKRTTTPDFMDKINNAITEIIDKGEYNDIAREYLYPVLLLQTISSSWFNYLTLLGVLSFSLSGVAIAARDNMTLFGTFLLAFIPCIPAGYIRDSIISNDQVHFSTIYILIVSAVVIFGFSAVRILDVFNRNAKRDKTMEIFWNNFFILTDALGQSSFIITGVSFAIVNRFAPIEIWGPVCAFLASNIGDIIRDLLTKSKQISALDGSINPEISVVWGLIFSLYIKMNSENPSLQSTALAAILVVIGAFSSKLAIIKYKVNNLRFK